MRSKVPSKYLRAWPQANVPLSLGQRGPFQQKVMVDTETRIWSERQNE